MDAWITSLCRSALLAAGLACLGGCSLPRHFGQPGTPQPQEIVRLCGADVPVDAYEIKKAVVAQVPLGAPIDEAVAALEAHGFNDGFSFWANTGEIAEPWQPMAGAAGLPVSRYLRRDIHGAWGMDYETIEARLFKDADNRVCSVEVYESRRGHSYRHFFEKHKELREPVGMTAAEAQQYLAGFGFQCTEQLDGTGPAARRCLYCLAYDEALIGGSMVRVQLFLDANGVVRDSEVLRDAPWFEHQRVMLPGRDDDPAWFACKALLFPVREVTRASLVAIAYTLYFSLLPYRG